MLKDWQRTEPREVRPFFQVQKAADAIAQSGIRLTDGGDVSQDLTFEIDEAEFAKLNLTVLPDLINHQLWMPSTLTPDEIDLVLLVRNPLLKRSELLGSYSLNESIPSELEISPETLEQLGGGRNIHITLALVLGGDKPPMPGSPFIVGHWLARKTFVLRASSNPVLFDIRTRTDEEWLALGYPAKTFYAVDYQGGIEAPQDDTSVSVATVVVHADAYNKLVDSKLGDSVQPWLSSEIISEILRLSLPDWETAQQAEKGSPLDSLLRQIQKSDDIKLPDLAQLTRSAPAKLKAILQSRLSVVQSLK
ncbi:hypothetical protein LC612_29490 [Nostoc sp. CHAB 5834]|nr:hypothetical protein [Nostoc sp. CHAB 5834]